MTCPLLRDISPPISQHLPLVSEHRQSIRCHGHPNQPKANYQRIIGSADISYCTFSHEWSWLWYQNSFRCGPCLRWTTTDHKRKCVSFSDVHSIAAHRSVHPWALPLPLEKRLGTRPPPEAIVAWDLRRTVVDQ